MIGGLSVTKKWYPRTIAELAQVCDTFRMKTRRVHFVTDAKQWEALERLSEKTGAPVSELLRRAVDAYLLKQNKEGK